MDTSWAATTSDALTNAWTLGVMNAWAVGTVTSTKPPLLPRAETEEMPSPVGGLMMRSEVPPGPSSLFVTLDAWVRSMRSVCSRSWPPVATRSMPSFPMRCVPWALPTTRLARPPLAVWSWNWLLVALTTV